jgi:hypothetical protein
MRYLKAEGYRAIRLEDLIATSLQKRHFRKKSVLITFDDGHKGFLQLRHPCSKSWASPRCYSLQTDQISQPRTRLTVLVRSA